MAALGKTARMPDKAQLLWEATKDIPECSICLTKVSDPVELKCRHIFDRHCIRNWLVQDKSCPLDRKAVKVGEFIERRDIYEKSKCEISAQFMRNTGSFTTLSAVLWSEVSIFSTLEKIQQKVTSIYAQQIPHEEMPLVERMTLGPFACNKNSTLADYQYLPGETISLILYLA